MGPVGSDGFLSQAVTTIVGETYNVSFWLASDGGAPNDFSASFAGVNILSLVDDGGFPYTQFSGNVMATSTSSTLQFGFRQDPAFWSLDDVCVSAGTGGTPTHRHLRTPTDSNAY